MKNQFVKITLILSMLLVMAIPAQAFAADQNCSLNSSNTSNITISKIYGKVPQATIDQLKAAFASGKIDSTQLQNILKQYCAQNQTTTPAAAKPTAVVPAKPATAPTVPAKPEAVPTTKPSAPTTAPSTPAAPAVPTTTTPAKPAAPTTTTPEKPAATTPATPSTTTTTTPTASLGSYEQQVVDLVNKERAAAGLPALKVNTKLAGVAEKKAEDLRDKGYFSHTSPTYGSPFDMMKQFGITYSSAGENIAKGSENTFRSNDRLDEFTRT